MIQGISKIRNVKSAWPCYIENMHPTPGDMKGPALPPDAVKAKRQTLYLLLGAAFLGIALFFGNFHVVQSEKGTAIVQKVHFTFSETFVSLDAITGQPLLVAKSQHPLAVKALQKGGYIETDEAFQQRIERETREAIEKNQQQFQAEMDQKAAEKETALYQDFKLSNLGANDMGVTGVLANKGSRAWRNVSVEFQILAKDQKTVIGTAMDFFNGDLEPGQSWKFNAIVAHTGEYYYKLKGLDGTPVE